MVFSASRGGAPQLVQRDLGTGADRDLSGPEAGFVIAIVPEVVAREQALTAILNWQAEIRR
jgi:hypothetical protein